MQQHYAEPRRPQVDTAVAIGERVADLDITFTATMSASGDLLLGSSRDDVGYDDSADAGIIRAIVQRSLQYLPGLDAEAALTAAIPRVGLRPHGAGGLPFVGRVAGVEGLLLNAGHSGSGLLLSPLSAAIIAGELSVDAATAWVLTDEKVMAAMTLLVPPPQS